MSVIVQWDANICLLWILKNISSFLRGLQSEYSADVAPRPSRTVLIASVITNPHTNDKHTKLSGFVKTEKRPRWIQNTFSIFGSTCWCELRTQPFCPFTFLSRKAFDHLQIKQSSPLSRTHLSLYCEQRSAAAGTERSRAEIILSPISYKYLTETRGEEPWGEKRDEEKGQMLGRKGLRNI